MADVSNLHRAVSNRGQWRDTFAIVASSAPDPSSAVFGVQVWPVDHRPGVSDYGWHFTGQTAILAATSDDASGRLTVAATPDAILLSWLFSATEMRRLCAGSYELGILAGIADEMAEIHRVRFVVQDRGGAPSPVISPSSSSLLPDPGGSGFAIDVKEF